MKYSKKSPLDFFSKKKNETIPKKKRCDYPGCECEGEYKAPKSRTSINDYYWFCLEHVVAYNKSWNYYDGLSEIEIELERRKSLYGDRPTWNQAGRNISRDDLLNRVFRSFGVDDDTPHQREMKKNTPELKALLDLGLQPPVSFKEIKNRYRKLVKKYHPDVNKNNKAYEEKIKKINNAYHILKKVYQ
ncbi:MAG: DnaJ domain-containing protein [Alphaproteobacteria bacterium]|nr:DnaJ domain-containing protein [Alphaproteobacteria bacterium]